MKLLVITSIIAFENDIKIMLKKTGVKTYSFQEVKGHKDFSDEAIESNWFAAETNEIESILFYAFASTKHTDQVFNLVNLFNAKLESQSHIHIAVLNIEKSNNPLLHIV